MSENFHYGEYVIYETGMLGPEEVMIEDHDSGNGTYDVRYINSETITTVPAERLHRQESEEDR